MGKPLSMDLRDRFAQLMSEGLNASAAGKALRISRATAVRWGRRYRDGDTLEPLRIGAPKGGGKLEALWGFFLELIEQDSDITLAELKAALWDAHGIDCSTSGLDSLLRRHGYTYKERGSSRRNATGFTCARHAANGPVGRR